MIYQLMYFSLAHDTTDENDVEDIVRLANDRNPLYGLTGFLSYNGAEFLQYLEGPELTIRNLMENIERDRRHYSVLLLMTGLHEKRIFGEWSMQRLPHSFCRAGGAAAVEREQMVDDIAGRLTSKFKDAYLQYLGR